MPDINLIVSVICIIAGGIAIGYIFYGLISEDARFILKYALVGLIICIAVFIGCNYKHFFYRSLHYPREFLETFNISVDSLERNGRSDIVVNADGSVDLLVSQAEYKRTENEVRRMIDDALTQASKDSTMYTKVEANSDYTEFDYYIKGKKVTVLEEIIPEMHTVFGKMYNVVFKKISDPVIKVVYFRSDTEEVIKETTYDY
ncbi:MAG: hypothetical protein K5888_00965 [Lachnospiraceae bacterium]|nr:hypothetical protein [Lachnospiraceae bacterium]